MQKPLLGSFAIDEAGHTPSISVFGDLITGQRNPDIIAKFAHGLSTFEVTTATTGSGTQNTGDGALTISTGAAINSSFTVSSVDAVRYLPGFAMYANFTAAFISTPEIGSSRSIGFTNGKDGLLIAEVDDSIRLQHIRSNGSLVSDVLRTDWHDKLDGTGESGLNIDFSKTNIFQITLGHLGIAPIVFWVHNGARFVPFHTLTFANLQTAPHLVNPYLKIIAKVVNTSKATATTLLTASWNAGSMQGSDIDPASSNRRFNQESSVVAVSTERPILTIRNKANYPTGGLENYVKVLLQSMQGVCEGTTTNLIKFRLYKNATLNAGTTTFSDKNSVDSCVEINTLATGFTGGTQVWFDAAARNVGFRFTIGDKFLGIYPNESYTLTAESASSVTVSVSFDWFEEH